MTDLLVGNKGKGGGGHTPVEAPDDLISVSKARILDLISEGEIKGLVNGAESVYLDKTPLKSSGQDNFEGVVLNWRVGTQDQAYIPGFPAVESATQQNVEFKDDTPWIRQFTNTELDAIRIQLSVPNLYKVDTSNGDTNGYKVEYAIDVSTDGGPYQEKLKTSFTGKTTTDYQRSHDIVLPEAQEGWNVRVRRITPNASSGTSPDRTFVAAYTEIIYGKFSYPNSAIVGLEISAKQFTGIPSRAYDIYGMIVRVPTNYDPETRVYTGTWDGTFKRAWTDNPAWIFMDLATNDRYGLGDRIPVGLIDAAELYRISRYCDQLVPDGFGGQEPRFTCNAYLQNRENAFDLLQKLASVFQGMSYYAAGYVTPVADQPKDPVAIFTNSDVVDGRFTRSGSPKSTRYTVALVGYNNRDNFFEQAIEAVEDREGLLRYGYQETQLTAFACSSRGQAHRAGRWALLTSQLETETTTFKVGLKGVRARPGDIILVEDQDFIGKMKGGLIAAATENTITADCDFEAEAGDTLTVMLPSGVAEQRTIDSVAGRVVTVTQNFSDVPQVQGSWGVDGAVRLETYRVLSVREVEEGSQFEFRCLEYRPDKFDAIANGTKLDDRPTTAIPPSLQPPPTNVTITQRIVKDQGLANTIATIAWDRAEGAIAYEVQWRRNEGEWIYAGRTSSQHVEIPNTYSGRYLARVVAVNVLDARSVPATSAETVLTGKNTPPPVVTHLTTAPLTWGVKASWGFPAKGAEDVQRTELWVSLTPDRSDATKLTDLAYPQASFSHIGINPLDEYYYWVRLVDRTGNIGAFYPSGQGVLGVPSRIANDYLDVIADEIVSSDLGQQMQEDIDTAQQAIDQEILDRVAAIDDTNEAVKLANINLANLQAEIGNNDAILVDISDRTAALEENQSDALEAVQTQADELAQLGEDLLQEVQDRQDSVNTTRDMLDARINSLQSDVSDLLGTEAYDSGTAYAEGDLVTYNDKLYRAIQSTQGNAPTNTTYWEKVGDYTSLGAVVGDLSSRVTSVEDVQADHSTVLDVVQTQDGPKSNVIQNLQDTDASQAQTLQTVQSKTNTNSNQIQTLQTTDANHASRLQTLESSSADQESRLSTVETTTDDLATRMQTVESRGDGWDNKVEQLEQADAETALQVVNLQAEIGNADANITEINQVQEGHATHLQKLDVKVGDQAASILNIQDVQQDQASELTQLSAKDDSHDSQIQNLSTVQADHTSQLNSLTTRVGDTESSIQNLDQTTGDQATSITQLKTRATNLEGRAEDLEEDVSSQGSAIQLIQQTQTNQAQSLSTLNTRTSEAENNIQSLQQTDTGQAQDITQLQSRADSLEDNVSENTTKVSQALSTTATQGQAISQLETTAGEHESSINSMLQTDKQYAQYLLNLQAGLGDDDGELTELRKVADDHAVHFEKLEVKTDKHASSIVNVQQVQADQAADIQQLRTDTDENSSSITNINQTQQGQAQAISDMQSRMPGGSGQLATQASLNSEASTRADEDAALGLRVDKVSARLGDQFDTLRTWNFDDGIEDWSGRGTPTQSAGWLRPANNTDPFVTTPNNLGVNGDLYNHVKIRIRKVGNINWEGALYWATPSNSQFGSGRRVDAVEPLFDALGVAVIDFPNIPWSGEISRLRFDPITEQTAGAYVEIDWVSIGRPAPAASSAGLQAEQLARASADSAMASDISQMQARMPSGSGALATAASVSNESSARVNADQALADNIDTLSASVGDNEAAVQATSQAIAGINGDLSAMYTLKSLVSDGGHRYFAGIGLGVENNPNGPGYQSQILFHADRLALWNNAGDKVDVPFAVENGLTILRRAMIAEASISSAKIVDGAVTNAKIANASINRAKIVNGAIGTAQIDNAAITNAKIANAQVDRLKLGANSATASAVYSAGGGMYTYGTYQNLLSGSLTLSEPSDILVIATVFSGATIATPATTFLPFFYFRLLIDGAVAYEWRITGYPTYAGSTQNGVAIDLKTDCSVIRNGLSAGTHTVILQQRSSDDRTVSGVTRRMFVLTRYR